MNSKTLLVLVALAAVSAAAAMLSMRSREDAVTVEQESGRFFPDLITSLNDVARVEVLAADASITLERGDAGWSVAEKDGYTAQAEPIRKLLIGVAELRKVEPKTADPERWSKLGVETPGGEGAASKLVTLKDEAGGELASLVVGNTRPTQGGRRLRQLYVRGADDEQSWLVDGEVDIKTSDVDWLETEILSIPQSRIQEIEIEHADGETLRVRKETEAEASFAVLDVPAERELRYPTVANPMAGGVSSLRLEDVQREGEVDFTDGWLSKTTVRTFDGLVLRATLKELDGKSYASFAASFEPPPGPPPAPEPAVTEGEGGEGGEENDPTPVAEVEEVGPSPEELQAEADELNARFAGWTFVVPQYNRTTMTKRMSDMLKEPEPDPSEPELGSDEMPVVIPDHLPPEIQEQIKAHQDSLGNKSVIREVPETREEAEAASGGDASGDGADGGGSGSTAGDGAN